MCVGVTEPSPLISASAEPRYQCQLQLIHAPSNTHQFLLSIVRSLSMSPHSVPSSSSGWCSDPCLLSGVVSWCSVSLAVSSLCVWILHSSPPFFCVVHRSPCATHHHHIIVIVYYPWLLIKYQYSLATCFLLLP